MEILQKLMLIKYCNRWLRQLLDRFHSIRIFAFRDGNRLEDAANASMPAMPEEKAMLRPPTEQRDVAKSSSSAADAPPTREEMEHQRYGEAQPQLVPSDVIETMMMGKGRRGRVLRAYKMRYQSDFIDFLRWDGYRDWNKEAVDYKQDVLECC